jgi:hypothetical protein
MHIRVINPAITASYRDIAARRTYGRPFVAGHRWPMPLPFGT